MKTPAYIVPLQYAVRVQISGDDIDQTHILPDRDQAIEYAKTVFNDARSRMIREDSIGDWMEIYVTSAYADENGIDPFLPDESDNGLWFDRESVDDQIDHEFWIWHEFFAYPDDLPDDDPYWNT